MKCRVRTAGKSNVLLLVLVFNWASFTGQCESSRAFWTKGCYDIRSDGFNILNNNTIHWNSPNRCADYCANDSQPFALQQDICYCLDSFPQKEISPYNDCTAICKGDNFSLCGSEFGSNIYNTVSRNDLDAMHLVNSQIGCGLFEKGVYSAKECSNRYKVLCKDIILQCLITTITEAPWSDQMVQCQQRWSGVVLEHLPAIENCNYRPYPETYWLPLFRPPEGIIPSMTTVSTLITTTTRLESTEPTSEITVDSKSRESVSRTLDNDTVTSTATSVANATQHAVTERTVHHTVTSQFHRPSTETVSQKSSNGRSVKSTASKGTTMFSFILSTAASRVTNATVDAAAKKPTLQESLSTASPLENRLDTIIIVCASAFGVVVIVVVIVVVVLGRGVVKIGRSLNTAEERMSSILEGGSLNSYRLESLQSARAPSALSLHSGNTRSLYSRRPRSLYSYKHSSRSQPIGTHRSLPLYRSNPIYDVGRPRSLCSCRNGTLYSKRLTPLYVGTVRSLQSFRPSIYGRSSSTSGSYEGSETFHPEHNNQQEVIQDFDSIGRSVTESEEHQQAYTQIMDDNRQSQMNDDDIVSL